MKFSFKLLSGFFCLALLSIAAPHNASAENVSYSLLGQPCPDLGATQITSNGAGVFACLTQNTAAAAAPACTAGNPPVTTGACVWKELTSNSFNVDDRYALLTAYRDYAANKVRVTLYGENATTAFQQNSPANFTVPGKRGDPPVNVTLTVDSGFLSKQEDVDGKWRLKATCNATDGWRLSGAWSFTNKADSDVQIGPSYFYEAATNDLLQAYSDARFVVACVKFDVTQD